MKRSADILNELIEIARDGQHFYLEAADRTRHPGVRDMFRAQAAVRDHLIRDLSHHVVAEGDAPSAQTTLLGDARKLYAEILAKLSSNSDAVYVSQLEEMEDRLVSHYKTALKEAGQDEVRRILQSHLPTVLSAHERMRELKHKQAA
jgi:uncharacterized protein (TIGR02284 family)